MKLKFIYYFFSILYLKRISARDSGTILGLHFPKFNRFFGDGVKKANNEVAAVRRHWPQSNKESRCK